MPRFSHPRLEDIPLDLALHALSDPVRLGILARLEKARSLNITEAAPYDGIPKSSLSNHFKLLRAGGLVQSQQVGREMMNSLRRAEFNARFPGLLDAVLTSWAPSTQLRRSPPGG